MSDLVTKWFNQFFFDQGLWSLIAGNSQYGFLGSRFVFAMGADSRLVFSPIGSISQGMKNPWLDLVMGLGDDVTFCYGARVTATYGGPQANIRRGSVINKTGGEQYNPAALNVPGGLFDPVRKPPPGSPRGLRVKLTDPVAEKDDIFSTVVLVLGVILNCVTTALELSMRYKYNNSFDETTGKVDVEKDPSDRLQSLKIAHRLLPRRLEAFIYHFEVTCTYGLFSFVMKDGIIRVLKYMLYLLMFVTVFPMVGYIAVTKLGMQIIPVVIALSVMAIILLLALLTVFLPGML